MTNERAFVLSECPVCGAGYGHGQLTISETGRTLLNCFRCGNDCAPSYAHELASTLEVPLGELLRKPYEQLRPWIQPYSGPRRARAPVDLPSKEAVGHACRTLQGDTWRLRYYTETRGLTLHTVRRYRLGLEGCYLLPVFEGGRIVNLVHHRPWARPPLKKYMGAAGHPAALYPNVPRRGPVLLVAGMIDALVARQCGLPAVTTTCGTALPAHLARRFRGKRVAVCYDAGEETSSARSVEKLLAAGASQAWVVSLPLPDKDDVADWFVKHGRTRADLLEEIRGVGRAR